ncbi:MAG: hypothetical protein Q9169_000272 [Polycauliona sp. 2 TL-2023]
MPNIRLAVEWDKTAVYAGESIDCVITFKNVAEGSSLPPSASQIGCQTSPRERWKDDTAAHARRQIPSPSPSPRYSSSAGLKHRKAQSHGAIGGGVVPATSRPRTRTEAQVEPNAPGQKHKRSVSIVSMGCETPMSETPFQTTSTPERPTRSHGRAASLQILPGKNLLLDHDPSFSLQSKAYPNHTSHSSQTQNNGDIPTIPSLLNHPSSSRDKEKLSSRTACAPDRPEVMQAATPHHRTASRNAASTAKSLGRSGKGSDVRSNDDSSDGPAQAQTAQSQSSRQEPSRGKIPGIISPQNNDGTPRSSTDLNSYSSNSSDTMASEYVMQEHSRFLRHPILMRQQSHLVASQAPETLMMGYGNVVGSFYLDPSLVDTSHFDEVKSKGVVGNEGGGGVVRAETTKRQSGLLGSLGWSSIGESLEGLLGRREVSSIKEGANAGAAKWMPILSTPQSLLFVDLRLEPGQSQSYSYSFRLPAGIPPSYRGKAVQFCYNIVIGVQRATRSRQRHLVRRINVPFQVLPSVNGME